MSALTIRLPDDKHQRLKDLLRQRHISVNRLIEEMTALNLEKSVAHEKHEMG